MAWTTQLKTPNLKLLYSSDLRTILFFFFHNVYFIPILLVISISHFTPSFIISPKCRKFFSLVLAYLYFRLYLSWFMFFPADCHDPCRSKICFQSTILAFLDCFVSQRLRKSSRFSASGTVSPAGLRLLNIVS